jgi:hypothetical protein
LVDWSIDRIDNTRGYEPDNIVVVSVKVNQAKRYLNLDEMIAVCFKTYSDFGDLVELEWFRMVSFYYTKINLSGEVLFSSPKLCLALEPIMTLIRSNRKRFDGYLLDCMYR